MYLQDKTGERVGSKNNPIYLGNLLSAAAHSIISEVGTSSKVSKNPLRSPEKSSFNLFSRNVSGRRKISKVRYQIFDRSDRKHLFRLLTNLYIGNNM
jgi:hypothetical protein